MTPVRSRKKSPPPNTFQKKNRSLFSPIVHPGPQSNEGGKLPESGEKTVASPTLSEMSGSWIPIPCPHPLAEWRTAN